MHLPFLLIVSCEQLPPDSTLIPVQVLGELFTVLVKKARRSRARARDAVLSWGDAYPLIDTSPDVLLAAMDLAASHRLSGWDAVVVAAAAAGRCRLLLSEDLQDGFTWSGVTVTNPFSSPRHPLLEAMLARHSTASSGGPRRSFSGGGGRSPGYKM